LDISETHGMENSTSADARRVGGPKGQALCVDDKIELADCSCCMAEDTTDYVGGDETELAKSIEVDAEGLSKIFAHQSERNTSQGNDRKE
jgi:hypothetical protein